jgi:hypothetical protein
MLKTGRVKAFLKLCSTIEIFAEPQTEDGKLAEAY